MNQLDIFLVIQNLLQHHVDPAIGVYIIDRYTYYALEFLENVDAESQRTIGEFVSDEIWPSVSLFLILDFCSAESLSETGLHIYCWCTEGPVPARSK